MESLSQTDQRWVLFLKDLQFALSNRLLQKLKDASWFSSTTNKLVELTLNSDQTSQIPKALEEFLESFADNFQRQQYLRYANIRDIELDETKIKHLNSMVTLLLKTPTTVTFEGKKKLVVTGPLITASEVEEYIKKNPALEIVEVFALSKIFIDHDLDTDGRKIQVTIIAPTWDVEGRARVKLDGKSGRDYEKDAGHLDVLGAPGNDGKEGLPGGSAGHFLGIGSTCLNCNQLTVTANGGPGGAGQDGGDGQKGKDGTRPTTPGYAFSNAAKCNRNLQHEWESAGHHPLLVMSEKYKEAWWAVEVDRQTWKVTGGGPAGGDGGNGGTGGKGGRAGTASLIMPGGVSATVRSDEGLPGKPGLKGKGALGGKREDLELYWDRWYDHCHEKEVKWSSGVLASGKDGKPGQPAEKISNRSSSTPLINLSYAITAYKNYLRENLKEPIIGTTLSKFLHYLETDEKIVSMYDTVGLVKDFLSLESQSRQLLKSGVPLMPFYQQLLNRVKTYKLQPHEKDAEEFKTVLSYLYRSALIKIHSINSDMSNDVVVNMRKNLALVSEDIEEWKDLRNLVEKNRTRNKYKGGIQNKIEEANDFINEEINKDIEKNIENTTAQLNELYEETVKLEKAARNEKEKLNEQKEKLERQLALRSILGVVQIAGQALALAGPVGVAAGAVIGGATAVAQNFMTNDNTTVAIAALPDAVSSTLTKINDAYKKKQEMFKTQLTNANVQLTEFLNSDEKSEKTSAKQSLKKIHDKITEAKGNLEKEMKKATIEDPASVSRMYDLRKDLNKLIEDQKKEIDNFGKESGQQAAKYAAAAEKVQNIIGLAKMGVDLYSKIQGDMSKIGEVDKSITKVNDKLKNLDAYEESIYTKIAPLIGRIRSSIVSAEQSDGKSHAALDVSKWQVQGSMRDVRREMQKMTKGFETGDEITYYIDKVEYGMSMMIQMYDRIQSYLDQGDLADVITNVDSSSDVSNNELYTAVSELKLKISSNIVVDYKNTMTALLQYVFPFPMNHLLDPLESIDSFNLKNTDQIADIIKSIEKALQRETTTTQGRDAKIIADATFVGDGKMHKPFFIWKYNEHSTSLQKLFLGEKVFLRAEISGAAENAVKFNEIGIRFRCSDKSVQDRLDTVLEDLSVELEHGGDSQYRCRNEIYAVSHQKQAIKHSVARDGNGEYAGGNLVYDKIKNNEPVLSPFASWGITLKSASDISALRHFIGHNIDLELEGHGSYVDGDVSCAGLSRYYKLQGVTRRLGGMDDFENIIEQLSDTAKTIAPKPDTYSGLVNHLDSRRLDPNPANITLLSPGSESNIRTAFKYGSPDVMGSLPLLDLMIRKINGSSRHRRSVGAGRDSDSGFAHNLAYRAYAPK